MSLSLHAGATVGELHRAARDPDRLVIVEMNDQLPRTFGIPPQFPHALHVDEVDVIVRNDVAPFVLADDVPSDVDRAIAEFARGVHRRRLHVADGNRRRAVDDRRGARRGAGRRLRRALGDVHDRSDAPAPGGQGDERPQG